MPPTVFIADSKSSSRLRCFRATVSSGSPRNTTSTDSAPPIDWTLIATRRRPPGAPAPSTQYRGNLRRNRCATTAIELGLVRKLVIRVRRRGARLARREEEEYSTYCDDEQRSQPGWIGSAIVSLISGRALTAPCAGTAPSGWPRPWPPLRAYLGRRFGRRRDHPRGRGR